MPKSKRFLVWRPENVLLTDSIVKALGLASVPDKFLSLSDPRGKSCTVCQIFCGSEINYQQHLKGRRHRLHENLEIFKKQESELKKDKIGLKLVAELTMNGETFSSGSDVNINIWTKSSENIKIILKFIIENEGINEPILANHFDLSLVRDFKWLNTSNRSIFIKKGQKITYELKLTANKPGLYTTTVAFKFKSPDAVIIKKIRINLSDESLKELEPVSKFQKVDSTIVNQRFSTVLKGEKLPIYTEVNLINKMPLEKYAMPGHLSAFLNKKFHDEDKGDGDKAVLKLPQDFRCLETSLNKSNHKERFQLLLYLEEHQLQIDVRRYDMKDHTNLERCHGHNYKLMVPGLAEKRPSLLVGDEIFVSFSQEEGRRGDKGAVEYLGYVQEVACDYVVINMHKNFSNHWVKGMKLNIRFTFNRLTHRLQHRSIELASEHSLTDYYLFPNQTDVVNSGLSSLKDKDQGIRMENFYNKNISDNVQQKLAVHNILNKTSKRLPFIVFGPPGTGKTSTIVEAIVQIYHTKKSNILACTPSNSSSDLLVERMLNFGVNERHILRMYAVSYNICNIPQRIKNCSNAKHTRIFFPSKEDLKSDYRIIVCTLATCGRLVSASLEQGHFSYVFIDEVGQATEPEALIPLAGICEPDVKEVQVVMAGDPKQLGPVLRSPTAVKFGLDISLLERYMTEIDVYKKISEEENFIAYQQQQQQQLQQQQQQQQQQLQQQLQHSHYHNDYIVKLLHNYRCHPTLLQVSNELFYDNELIPKADKVIVERFLGWEELPDPAIPLIFHGVRGSDQRESTSPSFFNIQEIVKVKYYIDELLKGSKKVKGQDIGVITPYRKQVQKLRQHLRSDLYKDINVASVEEYQGREKKVIIISTVRSSKEFLSYDSKFNIGFLRNPKRFNVAITRCQCLLIVIGDPYLLCGDVCWRRLLSYCMERNCYTGVPFNLNMNQGDDGDEDKDDGIDLSINGYNDEEKDAEDDVVDDSLDGDVSEDDIVDHDHDDALKIKQLCCKMKELMF